MAPDERTCTRSNHTPKDERARLRATFGAMVRAERINAGWTQRELAARVDYDISSVRMWENGVARPSETSTRRLAEVFRPFGTRVDIAELDLTLQRAAGPSLRRWRRTRAWSARRRESYSEAVRRLDAPAAPLTNAERVAAGRAAAALSEPWRPPQ